MYLVETGRDLVQAAERLRVPHIHEHTDCMLQGPMSAPSQTREDTAMGAGDDLLKGMCWFTPLIKVCGCLFTSLGLEETAPSQLLSKLPPTPTPIILFEAS